MRPLTREAVELEPETGQYLLVLASYYGRQDNRTATVLSQLPDDVDKVVEVFEMLTPMIVSSVKGTKAEPLLDEYVGKGFTFLGIKLQNGQDSGDIKPIALTMSEQAPCVPLKLTSIAATPEMPILVWVLGEGEQL